MPVVFDEAYEVLAVSRENRNIAVGIEQVSFLEVLPSVVFVNFGDVILKESDIGAAFVKAIRICYVLPMGFELAYEVASGGLYVMD